MSKSKLYIGAIFLLLIISTCLAFYFFIKNYDNLFYIFSIMFFVVVFVLYKIIRDFYKDFNNFVNAFRYRDLSQRFTINNAPIHLKTLRKGFNTIVEEYKKLSFEKAAQYHYLQNVLELVDTGIMAYNNSSGEVIWINQLMKEYLRIPYLKNISRLKKLQPQLFREIAEIPSREQRVINIMRAAEAQKFLLTASTFSSEDKTFKLIALQDVEETLDITESEAWKKLLRVLTHEIMNSIAPISSVATTLQARLKSVGSTESLTQSDLSDFQDGIATIKSRSNGLLRFSESYRNLNKIGALNPTIFYVHDLFESLITLMSPSFEQKNITLDIILKNPTLEIRADRELIEQVIINLLLNAIDAVKDKEEKQILLIAEANEKFKPFLKVSDNGSGMDKETVDKIFIPFFTTKKTGSGIGLSLCKQIMLLHKGSIQLKSVVGEGTTFSLHF